MAKYEEYLWSCAEKCRVPMFLIRGQLSNLITEETAIEFTQRIPNSTYVDVIDAAHMVFFSFFFLFQQRSNFKKNFFSRFQVIQMKFFVKQFSHFLKIYLQGSNQNYNFASPCLNFVNSHI